MLPTAFLAAALALVAGCAALPSPPSLPRPPAAEPYSAGPRPAAPPSASPAPRATEPAPGIDLTAFSTTDPASPWVVVNKTHPLEPATYAPADLVIVRGYYVRSIVAEDLTALLDAAAADGVPLTLRSTYRSFDKQRSVFQGLVSRNGEADADLVSARPGYSEHQTGLAVDVGSPTKDACDFDVCFATTTEGQWVAANAQRFGFIVRYGAGDEAITGYSYEPWHLRWVGRPLAGEMAATGVTTLEELFGVDGGREYR